MARWILRFAQSDCQYKAIDGGEADENVYTNVYTNDYADV
jgi:hypothetical protein